MKPIIEESDILQRIKDEKLDVWICGPGGCASNLLSQYLEEHHSLRTRTKAWHQLLGHFYKPLSCDIPKIYIYTDPVYTLHCTLCTLQYTLFTLHSALYTLHCTVYTLHSTLCTVHSALYTLHCTLCTVH